MLKELHIYVMNSMNMYMYKICDMWKYFSGIIQRFIW